MSKATKAKAQVVARYLAEKVYKVFENVRPDAWGNYRVTTTKDGKATMYRIHPQSLVVNVQEAIEHEYEYGSFKRTEKSWITIKSIDVQKTFDNLVKSGKITA